MKLPERQNKITAWQRLNRCHHYDYRALRSFELFELFLTLYIHHTCYFYLTVWCFGKVSRFIRPSAAAEFENLHVCSGHSTLFLGLPQPDRESAGRRHVG